MTTEKLGLPTIAGNQYADIPRDLNALAEAIDAKVGTAGGLAQLGEDGKLPPSQIGVDPSDLATKQELQAVDGKLTSHKADYLSHTGYAIATGTANVYIATLTPALSAYAEGVSLRLKINVENTGVSTVNVSGLGTKSIKKANGEDIQSGDLKAGSIYTLVFNGVNFQLQGEGGGLTAQQRTDFVLAVNAILVM